MRAAKALAGLRVCAGSSEPLLLAQSISTNSSCADSYNELSRNQKRIKRETKTGLFKIFHIRMLSFSLVSIRILVASLVEKHYST